MALIRINKAPENKFGKVSIDRERVQNQQTGENEIITTGVLSIHDYIEDIHEIETERYIVSGVDVYKESFGTNDNSIYYHFFADGISVKEEHVPDDVLWALEELELEKELKDKEYFHSYFTEEGLKEAEKIAIAYKEKEEKEGE